MNSKSALEYKLKRYELDNIRLRAEAALARHEGGHKSCLSCHHWSDPETKCIKYNMTPPLKIIVWSCPDFDHPLNLDDIPF